MKKLWTLLLTLVFVVGLILPAMTTTAYAQGGVAMTYIKSFADFCSCRDLYMGFIGSGF